MTPTRYADYYVWQIGYGIDADRRHYTYTAYPAEDRPDHTAKTEGPWNVYAESYGDYVTDHEDLPRVTLPNRDAARVYILDAIGVADDGSNLPPAQ